jgi:hypothetical protein
MIRLTPQVQLQVFCKMVCDAANALPPTMWKDAGYQDQRPGCVLPMGTLLTITVDLMSME